MRNHLEFMQPATRWQDALPTGNGHVGAMMYGQITNEQILLNHEALWCKQNEPKTADVSDVLPTVRKMIDDRKLWEAGKVFDETNKARGGDWTPPDPYQPFCDIRIVTETQSAFHHYRRGIDLNNGLVWMRWQEKDITFFRELFVSRADGIVVLRLLASEPGAISCKINLEAHDKGENFSARGFSARDNAPQVEYQTCQSDFWSVVTGKYQAYGEEFGAVARLVPSKGTLTSTPDHVAIENADELLVLVKLFALQPTDDGVKTCQEDLLQLEPDFNQLLTRHSKIHSELFNRTCVEFPHSSGSECVDELLLKAYDGDVPFALIKSMYEFGRHLQICANSDSGWPANLQGIWNGDYCPAWAADIHNDENIQMNYWAALPGMLPEMMLPLFDYFERHLDDYHENASKVFGCRGIVVPIAQSTHGKMPYSFWANWTAAAGWLAQHFYDYYLFTGDREFLRNRAVPWLKEVALFYEDFTFEDETGRLVFNPSISPENFTQAKGTEGNNIISINATMDVAVCREVLENLCDACELLEIEQDGIKRWQKMLAKLPAYDVNEDGAMREWLHPDFPENYHHRHQSHIYPVFPGFSVTSENDPVIYEACRVAVEKRLIIGLDSQTGWSMAHMANIYARLGDGDKALECIEILARSSLGPNLFTYHNDWRNMGLSLSGWGHTPPFQIDANFGITAAVLEMLVFSKPGLIKVLPALPTKWTEGKAGRIACRGQITVNLEWNNNAITVELQSQQTQTVTIGFPREITKINGTDVTIKDSDLGPSYHVIELEAGKTAVLDVL